LYILSAVAFGSKETIFKPFDFITEDGRTQKKRVIASYNRSELLAERIKMMQEYANYLDNLR
jgi:hypothetical protein